MVEGSIPVGAGDLPIDVVTMPEDSIYSTIIKGAVISSKLSRKGVLFCAVNTEVTDGDFEGRNLVMNYLPLPVAISRDATKAERIRAQDSNVMFERFCRAYKISGDMPIVRFGDSTSINAWQDWIKPFYGNGGRVTIRNQEFPEGSGRLRAGISDFVI